MRWLTRTNLRIIRVSEMKKLSKGKKLILMTNLLCEIIYSFSLVTNNCNLKMAEKLNGLFK